MNQSTSISQALTKLLLLGFCILCYQNASAQKDSIKYEIESQSIGTTGDVVPFWMRSNQFGSIPLAGISQSFVGRSYKDYSSFDSTDGVANNKRFDWGFGFEGRANIGKGSNLQLIEAYAKVKAGIFELKAGRSKDVMGLNGDTTLSSGNFAVSGNALGIPKVEVSIPEYWRIPIFDGLFSIKGNFAHGWVGDTKILDRTIGLNGQVAFITSNDNPRTYFHQKSIYGKIGKSNWKINLYGGFNHQVYWGNEQAAYDSNFDLSKVGTLLYVALGKTYGKNGIPRSKIGNQLGSIDIGAEYEFSNIKLLMYRQSFYDVGALSKLANISDGLNGFSLENKSFNTSSKKLKWKRILLELFYSKDQAGYPWSTPTKSGDEDYYNNFYYLNGWSYKDIGIGTPLITRRHEAKPGQAFKETDYFINNRLIAGHFGLSGAYLGMEFLTKVSFSRNYGTFGTSIYGNSTGNIRDTNTDNIFVPANQLSVYLHGTKKLNNKTQIGIATSFDRGKLLKSSFGLTLNLKKEF